MITIWFQYFYIAFSNEWAKKIVEKFVLEKKTFRSPIQRHCIP